MKAYESGSALYFATPPVNLINAFHTSLCQITKGSPTLEERFEQHRKVSKRIKDAAAELGLKQLPLDPAHAANGMTAVSHITTGRHRLSYAFLFPQMYFPENIGAADLLPRLSKRGVIVAGGLHTSIKGM
jgi:alanine-glyoxylate transaminase/serine-glyoxylate transaminase/serine-pyruvate transaminase